MTTNEASMAVECHIVYEGQLHCIATHGPSGARLATDAPVAAFCLFGVALLVGVMPALPPSTSRLSTIR